MTFSYKSNHVDEALGRLAEEFKNKETLAALIRAWVEEVQDIEGSIFDLFNKCLLAVATGAQLDGVGSIVGEARQGRNDKDYRTAIQARIWLLRGSGTPEDILGMLYVLTGGSVCEILEYPPASLVGWIQTPVVFLGFGHGPFGHFPFGHPPGGVVVVADIHVINRFFQEALPAGVRGDLEYSSSPVFKFDSGEGYDVGKWSDVLTA